jgi:Zn-dependent alcohol dehydrogenase
VRAAVCRAFGKPLVIEEVEIDPPQAGEISVRLAACAVCHSDISFMEGAWDGPLPAVYGHEAAGVVAEVGPGVTGVRPDERVVVTLIRSCGRCYFCTQGEPVFCESTYSLDERGPLRSGDGQRIVQGLRTGAFAEYVTVHASQVTAIPGDVPLDSGALLACGVLTGVGAVTNTARVTAGSSVVVIGTGGVGLNCVQGAALSGAEPIVAIDLSSAKLEAAKAFGATHTIDPTEEDSRQAVRRLTEGRGADYVFVAVGAKTAIEQGVGLMRRGGAMVIVGMPASGVTTEFDPSELANDGQRILGSKMGSAQLEVDVPKLVELYRQGRLKLDELISGRYALEEINEAVASANRGEALRNVIVF